MNATAEFPGAASVALTRELAAYVARARFSDLPEPIRLEAARAFTNWIGCVLGGCREPAVAIAASTVAEAGGRAQASVIGHTLRSDVASAAFVNCISSSVQAFDDAHLGTVTHPSGPAGAALFALSERHTTDGETFLNAFALGIELQCRLSNALVLPPSTFDPGLYVTGFSGPIGVALAAGNLLGLDEQRLNAAISLGASQASGFRATHGTMTAHFRPGHAARGAVWAALLAARGFTGDAHALEAKMGFFDVYAPGAKLERVLDGLGQHYELLSNAYKPYPCGIVIHPTLDACLDIRAQGGPQAQPVDATLRVHPLAISMTGVRTPRTPLESHVSLYHWAAAALLRGAAGLAETQQDCIDDPQVAALRARIEAVADPAVGRNQAIVAVRMADGRTLQAQVTDVRGSATRPMTDDELDTKFRDQARTVLPAAQVEHLLQQCRNVAALPDVGRGVAAILQA